ncbi:MAG: hypothetical protein WEB88_16060 [Gemmatimonadota bacterium]
MRFEDFERRAVEEWERIPESYKEGVDGLVVSREARAHPDRPGIYTLGECVTEEYHSDYAGPESLRSQLVLYYGSFRRLAMEEEGFDWEGELWETLTHELQHHLEALARDEGLLDVDYAVEENFKRVAGEPFDPVFYRGGEPLAPGVWLVDQDVFIEQPWPAAAPASAELTWEDAAWRVPVPPEPEGDVLLLRLANLESERGEVVLALVRPLGFGDRLRLLLRGGRLRGQEREVVAEPVTH